MCRVKLYFKEKDLVVLLFTLLCGAIYLFGAKSVSAQEEAGAKTTVRPVLSLSEQYSNNPASSPRGREGKHDYITIVSPGLILNLQKPKFSITGRYDLSIEKFANRSELDKVTHSADITLSNQISSRTHYVLSDRFAFIPDSVDATQSEILVERTDILSNSAAFSLTHTLRPLLDVDIILSDSITDFDNDAFTDSRKDEVSSGVEYKATSQTALNGRYRFQRFSFNQDDKVVLTHALTAGFTHNLSTGFSLSASVGGNYNDDTDKFDFIVNGDIDFTKGIETRTTKFTINYRRDINTATGLASETSTTQSLGLNINTTATRALSFLLTGNVSQTKSDITSSVDIVSYRAGVSAAYRFNSWLTSSLGYNHYKQDSDGTSGDDIKRDTVIFTITASPAGWSL